jgi:hypothetical protein
MPAPHSRDCVHRVSRRTWLKPWRTRNGWLPMQPIVSNMSCSVNKEAQLATMLTIGLAVALFSWALVYLASAPTYPHDVRRPTASRFRKWLDATRHRLLKARE